MRFRAPIAIAATAATLLLSACGSSEPSSIKELRSAIETAGYECQEPKVDSNSGATTSVCGDEIGAIWYEDASAEVAAYESLSKIYKNLPVTNYSIRGDQWRISGSESAVAKVAESLGKQVVTMGAK